MALTTDEVDLLKKQLAELKEIRYSGASRVKYRERDTTFRSDAELAAAIKDIEKQLTAATGRSGAAFAEYSSGL